MSISDKWIKDAKEQMAKKPDAWLNDAEQSFTRLLGDETGSEVQPDVKAWKTNFKDGAFQDIEYPKQEAGANTGPLYEHLDRVHKMASYGLLNNQTTYTSCAVEGLEFYAAKQYTTSNWYHVNIGIPRQIGRCLVVLAGTKQSPSKCLEYIQKVSNVDLNMEGTNQVDLGYNQLLWAFAGWKTTGDLKYLEYAFAASMEVSRCCEIATLSKPSWGEGIRVDYSFSQHNPYVTGKKDSVCSQLYAGSYGVVLLNKVFSVVSLLHGVFSMAPASRKNIELHMTEGLAWCGYAGYYDFHTRGRSISRKGGGGTGVWSKWIDVLLPTAEQPERLSELKKLATGEALTTPGFRGSRAFWTNDFLSHIDHDFAVFCKVISTRTVGTETGNGENLKGYYMGGGSYFVHTHGKEYEGIQPVWHWQYLPGTTVEEDSQFNYPKVEWGKGAWGSHDFSGVVSDGETGVATMILTRQNIKASRKTMITLPGELYCLGVVGDLDQVKNDVHTTVNQCWHNRSDGIRFELTGNTTDGFPSGKRTYNNIKWVRHDGLVYEFLLFSSVTVESTTCRGSWKSINEGLSDEQVSGDVFSLWLNHHRVNDDTYAYAIRKKENELSTRDFVCNSDLQYIFSKKKGMAAGAVFTPSTVIDLGEVKITPKNALAFIASIEASVLKLTISDPTQKLDAIEVKLEWKSNSYSHVINLPTDLDYRGKGVTLAFTDKGVR